MNRKAVLALKTGVSLGLVSLLIRNTDLKVVFDGLRAVNLYWFCGAIALTALTIFIRSYRWYLLLRIQGVYISLRAIQAITYMSIFFNNFFLGSLGGDVFRVYKTKAHSPLKSGALSSVLMDRITSLPMLFVTVGIVGLSNMSEKNPLITWKQLTTILLFGFLLFIIVLTSFFVLSKFNRSKFFSRFTKFYDAMLDFRSAIITYKDHKRAILISLILSLGFYLNTTVMIYFLARSTGVSVLITPLFFFVPLVMLLLMLPISINGIGLQEGAYVLYFNKIGIDAEHSLLIALLPRIVMLGFSLVGALFYLLEGAGHASGSNTNSGELR